MIIPIAFSVKRENQPEEFVLSDNELLPPRPLESTVRVTMVLLDTDDGRAKGFSAKVLYDQEAEPYHDLMTIYSANVAAAQAGVELPTWASPSYMRAVRDKLNELLGDDSAEEIKRLKQTLRRIHNHGQATSEIRGMVESAILYGPAWERRHHAQNKGKT